MIRDVRLCWAPVRRVHVHVRLQWPPVDLTSPVAASQLAASAFFVCVKMATQDLTSPVAANQLAAGAFFSVKMTTQALTSPVAANQLAAGAFFPVKMATLAARGKDLSGER